MKKKYGVILQDKETLVLGCDEEYISFDLKRELKVG
jgi:hypothetical protein